MPCRRVYTIPSRCYSTTNHSAVECPQLLYVARLFPKPYLSRVHTAGDRVLLAISETTFPLASSIIPVSAPPHDLPLLPWGVRDHATQLNVSVKHRRVHDIVSGALYPRNHGLRVIPIIWCPAVAGATASSTAPFAKLGVAAVAVVTRSSASPTDCRILRLPGSGACVTLAALLARSVLTSPPPTFPTTIADECMSV